LSKKKSSQEIKNKKKKTTYKRSQIGEKEIGRQKQKGENNTSYFPLSNAVFDFTV
jgi:hypothetical protein